MRGEKDNLHRMFSESSLRKERLMSHQSEILRSLIFSFSCRNAFSAQYETRMHSSRMRTARSSSRRGGLHQTPPSTGIRHPPRSRHLLGADPPPTRHSPGTRHPLDQAPPWDQAPPRPGTPLTRHPPGPGTSCEQNS